MSKNIFGIELEVYHKEGISRDDIIQKIADTIGSDKVYPEFIGYGRCHEPNIQKYWRVASDTSLSSRGVEIVTRAGVTISELEKVIDAVRPLIDINRMATSSDCGLHVHIGIMDFAHFKRRNNITTRDGLLKAIKGKNVKKFDITLNQTYSYFSSVINALVARSRRGSSWCRLPSSYYTDLTDDQKQNYYNNKSRSAPYDGSRGAVNFGALSRYGTVEFRQHQGTFNKTTIVNWIKLVHRMTSRCWNPEVEHLMFDDYPVTVDGLCDFLGLGENRLRSWMKRRVRHFGFDGLARGNNVDPSVGRSGGD